MRTDNYLDRAEKETWEFHLAHQEDADRFEHMALSTEAERIKFAREIAKMLAGLTRTNQHLWLHMQGVRKDLVGFSAVSLVQIGLLALILWRVW